MIPAAFDYLAPGSVDGATAALAEHGDEAKILAGGHSLLPLMKLRLAAPAILIDLGRIDALRYIRETDGVIAIGAMTPYVEIERSDVIRRRVPLLAQAASLVGDMQVRNRGTLGGAIAHADPAGDMPTVVTALGGSVVAHGTKGEREIAIDDLFEDIFTSALGPDEVLVEVRIQPQDGAVGQYTKFRRRQIDWAVVGVAVNLTVTGGTIDSARIALTNVGPTPMRASAVEQALRGADRTTAPEAAELADRDIDPSSELSGSASYKRHLARVLTRRALQDALGAA